MKEWRDLFGAERVLERGILEIEEANVRTLARSLAETQTAHRTMIEDLERVCGDEVD
jgi:hypothetical protein